MLIEHYYSTAALRPGGESLLPPVSFLAPEVTIGRFAGFSFFA